MKDLRKFKEKLNNGEAVYGIFSKTSDPMFIEIMGIAVGLSARGKGIGSHMINQIVDDYSLISVYAETDNDAVGFYQKNGFSITEFSKIYDGETFIRYKCELTI